jgi:undecaprenyl-diphosphatase
VDVGMIAERPFLNTASFGAYSMFVDRRESLEERLGKWPAAMVALVEMMRTNTPVRVEIDGQQMSIWAIFIGNGPYAPQGFIPLRRTALADGLLDVRVLRADRSRPEIMVAQGLSRMQRSSAFEAWSCEAIDVRSLDGPLRLAHDGETFDGPASFRVEKSPKQLSVFVPQQKG